MNNEYGFKRTEIGMIPKEWKISKWGDLATLEYGKSLKGHQNSSGEFPVFGTNGQIGWCKTPLYPSEGVIIGRKGAYRGVHYSPKPFFVIDTAFFLKPIAKFSMKWAYYELLTHDINTMDSGSAIPSTTRPDFYSMLVKYPPLAEQEAIAKVLSDLDSKIELNNQMNRTLEGIGKALFKHWFMDFEFPNEEGKPYRSSGGEMVYNKELGKEIPKGWEISNVNKEFDLVMGQSPPGSSYNETGEGVVFFQGKTDFGPRFPSIRMFCTQPTRFAKKGDTLISVRAPVGDINLALEACCIGRGLAAIRHKSDSSPYTYYLMMTLKPTFDYFEAQGTVFGSLSKADFEKIKVLAPSKQVINRFQNTVGSVDKKNEDNTLQTLTLSGVRDSLLPKLMSGKIRVPVEVR